MKTKNYQFIKRPILVRNTQWILRIMLLVCLVLVLGGCAADGSDTASNAAQNSAQGEAPVEEEPVEQTLKVFAASSLTDAFTEIGQKFEATNRGVRVLLNFASSSQLAAQLVENVDADVFASANEKQMQVVVDSGRITTTPSIFTTNRLTIIVPSDNPAGIQSPADLANPGIALVLAAPEVPVRGYSDQVIAMLGDETYQAAVYANLISEEANVRQVVAKVALGEADAGMVYTSDITPDVADKLLVISIPQEFNVVAQYPIAVLDSGNVELAQRFINYVLNDEGQAVMKTWGFGLTE
jgi:molybdate transport system substrate-binding protein